MKEHFKQIQVFNENGLMVFPIKKLPTSLVLVSQASYN